MGKKVLIVEDHADARETLALLLRFEGFSVITAEDGLEGLEKAQAERPALIITDITMPRLNGIDMIRHLREQSELNEIPIIVMTAYGDRVLSAACEEGASLALSKPIDVDLLIETVQDLLN